MLSVPDPNHINSFMNFRVADIQACYELWKSRGAEFITEPIPKYGEIRCYIRDPDGYIIEVGQSTDLKYGYAEELTMSHHYSGPNIGFPRGDARLDLTDLYAFPKPGDPGKSILIMNFHPSVGVNPPGPTTSEPFAPEARYELKIDTDGDAVANISLRGALRVGCRRRADRDAAPL